MKLAIVIAAAGAGRRFGTDKLTVALSGKSVLETAIGRLREALPAVPAIAVVSSNSVDMWQQVLRVDQVVAGGDRRQDSVRIGVDAAIVLGIDTVLIHDGARPLVDADDIRAVVGAIEGVDGAVLSEPVTDTVKRVGEGNMVIETIDRGSLRLVQTPQVFRVAALERAWRRQGPSREWSDEAALIEVDGGEVRCVEAKRPNPKVTTAADLEVVRALIGEDP